MLSTAEITRPCTRKTCQVHPAFVLLQGERKESREERAEHTGEHLSYRFTPEHILQPLPTTG